MSEQMQKVSLSGMNYKRPHEWSVGEVIEGTYIETKVGEVYGKPEYKIATETGTVILNSCGQLVGLFEKIAPGAKVKVTYLGTQPKKSGKFAGKPCHNFDVEASKLLGSAADIKSKILDLKKGA